MASTELRQNGSDIRKMTDKERRFVLEYMIDYNATRAALAAGYAKKSAGVQGAKVLARKHIKAYIGKRQRLDQEKFEIQRHEVLWHLWACATRNGKQFVDAGGKLLLNDQNINDLPDEVTAAIDGIKQKVRRYTLADGEEVEEIDTEIKLVPKAQAIEMAMKHKGLFAAEKTSIRMSFDFEDMFRDQRDTIDVDPIEKRLEDERG